MNQYVEENFSLKGRDGINLYGQAWNVPDPKGIVVLVHGLGEHCGRYGNLIQSLSGKGIAFYGLDHRGHGRSEGQRGHIDSFSQYLDDLKVLVARVRAEHPKLPLIMLGHSMGGTIACRYAIAYPEDIEALILSSAGLIPAVKVPGWKALAGRIMSRLFPHISMSNGLDANGLSHDQAVVEAYLKDPLVHDRVTARWFTEFTKAGEECLALASRIEKPLLVIHGRKDPIVDCRGSEQVYHQASSPDKELYIFDGLYHETMNELQEERDKVLAVIEGWIMKHVQA